MGSANTPETFWARVDRRGGPEACWPWLGAREWAGHGVLSYQGKRTKAHRLAWVLMGNPDPGRLDLSHVCPGGGNAWCCNPAHLIAESHAKNLQRARDAGRMIGRQSYRGQSIRAEHEGSRRAEPRSLTDRIADLTDRDGPLPEAHPEYGQCWLWTGYRVWSGYGMMTVGTAREGTRGGGVVTRVLWEALTGTTLEDTDEIGHTCDNRACVRADESGTYEVAGTCYVRLGHLWLGNAKANALDRKAKGRGGKKELPVCKRGHDMTDPENLSVYYDPKRGKEHRKCRECGRIENRRWYAEHPGYQIGKSKKRKARVSAVADTRAGAGEEAAG